MNILSTRNTEEIGPKRFTDVKGVATHTSVNRPWFGRRKGKMKQGEILRQCFRNYFCVFSSAFPISVFEVYGLAGSFKSKRALNFLPVYPVFLSGSRDSGQAARPSSL